MENKRIKIGEYLYKAMDSDNYTIHEPYLSVRGFPNACKAYRIVKIKDPDTLVSYLKAVHPKTNTFSPQFVRQFFMLKRTRIVHKGFNKHFIDS